MDSDSGEVSFMGNVRLIPSVGALLLAAGPLHAATEWKHEIAPYLWSAAMDGTSGAGNVVAHIDRSFSDLLDDLEFGLTGTGRATGCATAASFPAGSATTARRPSSRQRDRWAIRRRPRAPSAGCIPSSERTIRLRSRTRGR
jgi:hypothetical protein